MKRFYGIMGNATKFMTTLTLVKSSNSGWDEKYIDKSTGKRWHKFMVDRDTGHYYNLMLETPKPTTEEMIEIVLNSNDHDEVEGAAHRLLYDEEELMIEFRPQLADKLKLWNLENISKNEKERLRTIILNTKLKDTRNKRNVVGKNLKEIQSDADMFEDIGKFADNLLKRLD